MTSEEEKTVIDYLFETVGTERIAKLFGPERLVELLSQEQVLNKLTLEQREQLRRALEN